MAKQATRLSDFQIPRAESGSSDVGVSGSAADAPERSIAVGSPQPLTHRSPSDLADERVFDRDVVPVRIAPRPPSEPRQAMTVRLPVSMHERMRMLMFASRRSQQDIVEEALNAFLSANGA